MLKSTLSMLGKTLYSDDIKFAIQWKVNSSFSQSPPGEVLSELARNRNKIPLPKSIPGPGIPLPPDQDTLINPNYQLAIARRQMTLAVEEREDGEESVEPNASSQDQTMADLPHGTPQQVSFPIGSQHPR